MIWFLVLLCLLVLVFPLLGRPAEYDLEPSGADETEDPIIGRRDVALEALRDLDFEHRSGKLADVDHEILRERYLAEAAASQRALEQQRVEFLSSIESRVERRRK